MVVCDYTTDSTTNGICCNEHTNLTELLPPHSEQDGLNGGIVLSQCLLL